MATSPNRFGFVEYRVVGTYRGAARAESYGDLVATAAVEQGCAPVSTSPGRGSTPELTHRLTPTIRGSARYAFVTTRIFDDVQLAEDDRLTVDRVFRRCGSPRLSTAVARDTRDDILEPQKGTLISADATLAARLIGSEVGFTKTFLQGFVYRNLRQAAPRVCRAAPGSASPAPSERVVDERRRRRQSHSAGRPRSARERAILRGRRYDDPRLRARFRRRAGDDYAGRGFRIGGDAEIVLNAELRTPVRGPIGAALFADAGNVFVRATDVKLTSLLGAVGFGVRYRSPIGPIRVDLGFKLDRRIIGSNTP